MFQIPEAMLNYWQKKNKPKATAADIQVIEASLGINLPIPYLDFITQFGFVVFQSGIDEMRDTFDYTITYPDRVEVHEGDIAYVFDLNRVMAAYNTMTDPNYDEWTPCFPRNYLPVAGDAGQGSILLELGGDRPGRVWYWTEKQWPWGEEDNTWLGFVAENFYDFINKLHPYRG